MSKKSTVRIFAVLAIAFFLTVVGDAHAKGVVVGSPAPPFSGTTMAGDEVSLEAMRGNVIIVNFWATWCAPCRVELPLLHSYALHREKNGLRVVAVTLDRNTASARVLRQLQAELALPLLRRFEGDYAPIGRRVPTNYIIDRAGIVRYAKADAFTLDELNEILVPLLNERPPPAEAPAAASSDSTVANTPPPASDASKTPPAAPPQ